MQKNSSSDEREMQQQIPTSETKAEERANAKDETLSTAALGASSAAVDVYDILFLEDFMVNCCKNINKPQFELEQ